MFKMYFDAFWGFIKTNAEALKIIFAVVGGLFALKQWRTQVMHKRAEIVKELICKVRDDEDISKVMRMIDWNNGFEYYGKFMYKGVNKEGKEILIISESLGRRFDKTLSHYAYICYLLKRAALQKKDIYMFEYGLKRIFDNPHIRNYLYSIYHWSKSRGAKCSFEYLIKYGLKKHFLSKDFKKVNSPN